MALCQYPAKLTSTHKSRACPYGGPRPGRTGLTVPSGNAGLLHLREEQVFLLPVVAAVGKAPDKVHDALQMFGVHRFPDFQPPGDTLQDVQHTLDSVVFRYQFLSWPHHFTSVTEKVPWYWTQIVTLVLLFIVAAIVIWAALAGQKAGGLLGGGAVVGAQVGAAIIKCFQPHTLKFIFGLYFLYVSLKFVLGYFGIHIW